MALRQTRLLVFYQSGLPVLGGLLVFGLFVAVVVGTLHYTTIHARAGPRPSPSAAHGSLLGQAVDAVCEGAGWRAPTAADAVVSSPTTVYATGAPPWGIRAGLVAAAPNARVPCRACLDDGDCAHDRVCDGVAGRCVACTRNSHCAAAFHDDATGAPVPAVCRQKTNTCHPTAAAAAAVAAGQLVATTSWTARTACTSDADCAVATAAGRATPQCHPERHVCVGCLVDAQCPGAHRCDVVHNQCRLPCTGGDDHSPCFPAVGTLGAPRPAWSVHRRLFARRSAAYLHACDPLRSPTTPEGEDPCRLDGSGRTACRRDSDCDGALVRPFTVCHTDEAGDVAGAGGRCAPLWPAVPRTLPTLEDAADDLRHALVLDLPDRGPQGRLTSTGDARRVLQQLHAYAYAGNQPATARVVPPVLFPGAPRPAWVRRAPAATRTPLVCLARYNGVHARWALLLARPGHRGLWQLALAVRGDDGAAPALAAVPLARPFDAHVRFPFRVRRAADAAVLDAAGWTAARRRGEAVVWELPPAPHAAGGEAFHLALHPVSGHLRGVPPPEAGTAPPRWFHGAPDGLV